MFVTLLRKLAGKSGPFTRRPARALSRPTRLHVEALEDRAVPTAVLMDYTAPPSGSEPALTVLDSSVGGSFEDLLGKGAGSVEYAAAAGTLSGPGGDIALCGAFGGSLENVFGGTIGGGMENVLGGDFRGGQEIPSAYDFRGGEEIPS
jgi:hypothetical protein